MGMEQRELMSLHACQQLDFWTGAMQLTFTS